VLSLFRRVVSETGAGVVLVTHSRLAAAAADRVLILTPQGLVDEKK
jgi:putative ABC transport system ATP-binding protein